MTFRIKYNQEGIVPEIEVQQLHLVISNLCVIVQSHSPSNYLVRGNEKQVVAALKNTKWIVIKE